MLIWHTPGNIVLAETFLTVNSSIFFLNECCAMMQIEHLTAVNAVDESNIMSATTSRRISKWSGCIELINFVDLPPDSSTAVSGWKARERQVKTPLRLKCSSERPIFW
jgi:hypothetical protein